MALTDNLVSYWKLDESSGNASDSVGSNTLTNNNSATYSAGKINNSVSLNGSSQYLSIADASQSGLDFGTGAFSISLWIKSSQSATGREILEKQWISSGGYYQIAWGNSTAGTIKFEGGSNGAAVFALYTTTATYNDNAWHHLVLVRSSNTVTAYIDGSLSGSNTASGSFDTSNDGVFQIGRGNSGYYSGLVDEVGVWSRALSSTEVTQLYNDGDGWQYPFSTGVEFTVSEALSLAETSTNLRARNFTTSETLSLSETITALKGIAFTIADSLGLVETFNTAQTFVFNITDNLGLIEVLAQVKKKWTNLTKNSATFTNTTKNSSTWTNLDKSA